MNNEAVIGVFFDMVFFDMVLIKLDRMGIKGRLYNWVMDFLQGQTIQVGVGTEYSDIYQIDSVAPYF